MGYKRTLRETLHLSFKHKVDFCMIGTSELISSTRGTGSSTGGREMTGTRWVPVLRSPGGLCTSASQVLQNSKFTCAALHPPGGIFQRKHLELEEKVLTSPGSRAFITPCRSQQGL